MDATADLSQLERSAFRKFYGDGVFDMYLGAMLGFLPVAGMMTDAFENEWLGLLLTLGIYASLLGGYALLRHYFTKPRIGTFTPAAPRKRKILRARVVLILSIVAGLVVFWLFASGNASSSPSWLPVAWLLNSVIVFGAMAYFLDVPRFLIYGIAFGMTVMIDEWTTMAFGIDLSPMIVFGLPGLGILLFGARRFVRFIRTNPVVPAEEATGDSLV